MRLEGPPSAIKKATEAKKGICLHATFQAALAKKRQLARENGLCITCCRRRPKIGQAVCLACKESAKLRSEARRKRIRADRISRTYQALSLDRRRRFRAGHP